MYTMPRTIANDRFAFRPMIALAAVAIVLSSTTVAVDLNNNTNSVVDESCTCVPFYQCDQGDEVKIPLSTSAGCLKEWICCRNKSNDTIGETLTASGLQPNDISLDNGVDQQQCTCVPKNQCLIDDYSVQPTYNVSAGNCSYDQVCCNKNHTVIGGINENNQNNNNNNNNNNNARSCGVGIPSQENETDLRIINHDYDFSKTHFGQFPWMVAIMKTYIDPSTGMKTNDFLYLCGGSLIHPQVILTAAHCVKEQRLNELKVRVGEWDTLSNNTEQGHQDISVSEIVTHPNFNNGSMHNDVALIKLSSEVAFQQHVNTICIPNPTVQSNYDSESCVVTGWGKHAFDKKGRYQNVLKAVYLSMVPHNVCQQNLTRTRLGQHFVLDKSFVCAGGANKQDACAGDGGGPLICAAAENANTSSSLKKYIQVGIVSWGIGCGEENVPGVYSSVAANSEWINRQMLDTLKQ